MTETHNFNCQDDLLTAQTLTVTRRPVAANQASCYHNSVCAVKRMLFVCEEGFLQCGICYASKKLQKMLAIYNTKYRYNCRENDACAITQKQ